MSTLWVVLGWNIVSAVSRLTKNRGLFFSIVLIRDESNMADGAWP